MLLEPWKILTRTRISDEGSVETDTSGKIIIRRVIVYEDIYPNQEAYDAHLKQWQDDIARLLGDK